VTFPGFVTHVTVLVGIACNGSPIGGVIHQPFLVEGDVTGRTLWGIPGVGFGGFTAKLPPKDKRIITTTTSHSNPRVEAVVNSMKADEVLRVGGAGHKAILLMEGRAHAYVFASRGCKKWDTCAPEAVLTAIGGKLTDMNGEHYVYSKDVSLTRKCVTEEQSIIITVKYKTIHSCNLQFRF
jgi:3'(2'), 5'-bisphosphate nucleotidase